MVVVMVEIVGVVNIVVVVVIDDDEEDSGCMGW